MERQACIYLLASKKNGTLHVGVTSDLIKRVWEHKQHVVDGFTYREKAIKEWKRSWNIRMIEEKNPRWKDLSDQFLTPGSRPSPG